MIGRSDSSRMPVVASNLTCAIIDGVQSYETWLVNTAAPALDSIRGNPTKGRSSAQVRDAVRARIITRAWCRVFVLHQR